MLIRKNPMGLTAVRRMSIRCPNCAGELQGLLLGRWVWPGGVYRCKQCGRTFRVKHTGLLWLLEFCFFIFLLFSIAYSSFWMGRALGIIPLDRSPEFSASYVYFLLGSIGYWPNYLLVVPSVIALVHLLVYLLLFNYLERRFLQFLEVPK